uniref:Ataxin-7-like protein 3 n=2 Tax=Astyanax mexicanus TaxID=7994 RepID=W5KXZ1_ASTMX
MCVCISFNCYSLCTTACRDGSAFPFWFLQMKMEEMALSGMDNSKMEGIAQEILADLVEDACLGLCFEVHRAVKQGYFFLDDTDQESTKDFEIVDQPGVDIFGQVYNQWKNKECVCPNCSRSIAASRFAPHLEKCLGMGRNSSRIANRRIASGNNTNKSESDQEDNDDVNDNDWSYGAEKKTKKRKADKVFLHSLSNLLKFCKTVLKLLIPSYC